MLENKRNVTIFSREKSKVFFSNNFQGLPGGPVTDLHMSVLVSAIQWTVDIIGCTHKKTFYKKVIYDTTIAMIEEIERSRNEILSSGRILNN